VLLHIKYTKRSRNDSAACGWLQACASSAACGGDSTCQGQDWQQGEKFCAHCGFPPVPLKLDDARRRPPPLYGWSTEIAVTDVADVQLAPDDRSGIELVRQRVPVRTDDAGSELSNAIEPDPDVIWSTPSPNVSGSMPLGNGKLGMSVYSTRADEVQLLISHTDSVDETGALVKIGRLVVRLVGAGSVDRSGSYRAAYYISNMTICLQLGRIHAQVWVDANFPVIRVATTGPTHALEISLHLWKRLGPVQDVVVPNATNSLAWYHNNSAVGDPFVWESLLNYEGLGDFTRLSTSHNPLTNITFGAFVHTSSEAHTNTSGIQLVTAAATSQLLSVAADAYKTSSLVAFMAALCAHASTKVNRIAHNTAWEEFHSRSFINITAASHPRNATLAASASQVTLLDRITRTSFHAMAGGEFAIKLWDYGIFSAHNGTSAGPADNGGFPTTWDGRSWGACDWFQNTRLPYYHMLASGDLESMKSLFGFYGSFLDVSQYRAARWFPELLNDAAFFPEVVQQFGAYCDTPFGPNSSFIPAIPLAGITNALEPSNTNLRYHREGGLELSHLALDWLDHSGDAEYFERVLLPQIIAYVGYYAQFSRDPATGLLDIYPANSLETWQCAKLGPPTRETCVTGPMPEIAALSTVLPRLLALPRPNSTVTSTWDMLKELWSDMFYHLPPLPAGHASRVRICTTTGCRMYEPPDEPVLLPGWRLPNATGNTENSELYAVHPYRMVGLFANRSLGEATYRSRRFPGNSGWDQDVMDAALLGLPGSASAGMIAERAARPPALGYRWLGFQGGLGCGGPCTDHMGVSTAALRYMLIQTALRGDIDANAIVLFPSWPSLLDSDPPEQYCCCSWAPRNIYYCESL
jgi:hypothetical protein